MGRVLHWSATSADTNGYPVRATCGRSRMRGDAARYFVEMHLHGPRIGVGQSECCTLAECGTCRAEQVGVLVALFGGLSRPRYPSRPLPNDAIFLADLRFVLKPDFDRRGPRNVPEMCVQSC